MEIEDNAQYKFPGLREYLRGLGLPCSKPTIIKYEKQGMIPSPRLESEGAKIRPRYYTGLVMKQIAAIIRSQIK